MITTPSSSIDCLLEKELIDEDRADEMKKIVAVLPQDPSSLLQLLVALNLTEA